MRKWAVWLILGFLAVAWWYWMAVATHKRNVARLSIGPYLISVDAEEDCDTSSIFFFYDIVSNEVPLMMRPCMFHIGQGPLDVAAETSFVITASNEFAFAVAKASDIDGVYIVYDTRSGWNWPHSGDDNDPGTHDRTTNIVGEMNRLLGRSLELRGMF